jgi:hypothetical protein
MGKFGLIPLFYGVACLIFNFAGIIVKGIPDLGVLGSWLFNPLGMAFSDPIASYLIANVGADVWLIGDLFTNGAAWAVGGFFGLIWTFGLLFLGVKLLFRKSSGGASRVLKPY